MVIKLCICFTELRKISQNQSHSLATLHTIFTSHCGGTKQRLISVMHHWRKQEMLFWRKKMLFWFRDNLNKNDLDVIQKLQSSFGKTFLENTSEQYFGKLISKNLLKKFESVYYISYLELYLFTQQNSAMLYRILFKRILSFKSG